MAFFLVPFVSSLTFYLCMLYAWIKQKKSLYLKFIVGQYLLTVAINFFVWLPLRLQNMTVTNIIWLVIGLLFASSSIDWQKKNFKPDGIVQNVQKGMTKKIFRFVSLGVIAVILIALGGIWYQLSLKQYSYNQLQVQKENKAFNITQEKTPLAISPLGVREKMNNAMSSVPSPEKSKLGELQVQKIKNKVVYVAPIEFNDIAFWKKNYTPGYFVQSATERNENPKFVDYKMNYTQNSFFTKNVRFQMYKNHPSYLFAGKLQMEVDDNGKPWYIQTVYKTYPYSSKKDFKSLKVIVLDPVDGKTKLYDVDKAPAFINGSISPEIAGDMNDVLGKWVHGWWNPGQKDMKKVNHTGTEGEKQVTPIFMEDGHMYYFTDFTTINSNANSSLGYSLIDARTGKTKYFSGRYKDSHGREKPILDSKKALNMAEAEQPEKKWTGNMPLLYDIDGVPTWVVSILDRNGLFKRYCYINATDNDVIVFGDSPESALASYRLKLAGQTSNATPTKNKVKATTLQGVVQRVATTTNKNNKTVVHFLLQGQTISFEVETEKVPKIIFLKEGDSVTVTGYVNKEKQEMVLKEITVPGLFEKVKITE